MQHCTRPYDALGFPSWATMGAMAVRTYGRISSAFSRRLVGSCISACPIPASRDSVAAGLAAASTARLSLNPACHGMRKRGANGMGSWRGEFQ